jgi:hypothetical protein
LAAENVQGIEWRESDLGEGRAVSRNAQTEGPFTISLEEPSVSAYTFKLAN